MQCDIPHGTQPDVIIDELPLNGTFFRCIGAACVMCRSSGFVTVVISRRCSWNICNWNKRRVPSERGSCSLSWVLCRHTASKTPPCLLPTLLLFNAPEAAGVNDRRTTRAHAEIGTFLDWSGTKGSSICEGALACCAISQIQRDGALPV